MFHSDSAERESKGRGEGDFPKEQVGWRRSGVFDRHPCAKFAWPAEVLTAGDTRCF